MSTTANEHHLLPINKRTNFKPSWIDDIPDDWSHTVDVTSEYPVMRKKPGDASLRTDNSEADHSDEGWSYSDTNSKAA